MRALRRGAGERGQSLVELGVLLPLLLVLVIGVIEVSAAFNSYITVVSSARDGARLGAKGAATDAEIKTLVVKDLGNLRFTTPTSNITVTHTTVDSRTALRVEACYDHKTLLQAPLILPKTYRICSQTTMPVLN